MTGTVNLDDESIRRLVAAMQSNNRQQSAASTTSASGKDSKFSTKLEKAGETALGFSGFIGQAGGSVNEFAKAMGGGAVKFNLFGGAIDNSVGYIEGLNQTFQNLSKVGAGFNGDLGALAAAASNTRMQVGEFADVVGNNAKDLAGLGAGVNKGAQRFSELSRAMFEDGQVIEGMLNLGYNIRESNEALLDNATMLSRQQRLTGMSDDAVAQATLEMAANMAEIAEVTGKSAKQQREELMDANRDGKNIAANRALESQGIKDASQTFNQVFTALGPLGSAAQAYAQDMNQARAPLTKLTQNFETIAPQTAAIIKEMDAVRKSNLTTAEKTARISALETQARATYAREMNSSQVLASARLGQINERGATAAEMLAETERFRQGIEQTRAEMAKERAEARGERYTGGYGDVTEAEAAERLTSRTANRVGAQAAGGAEGQAMSREMNKATIGLANTAARVNNEIGKNLSANTELQNTAKKALEGLTGISEGLAATAEAALKLLPGSPESGVLSVNPFKEVFDPIVSNGAMNVRILEEARVARDGEKALGGSVSANRAYRVGESGEETFVPGMDGAIIPNMKNMLNRLPEITSRLQEDMSQFGAPLSQAARSAAAMGGMSSDDIGALVQHAQLTNELLSRLVGVNTAQVRVNEKQLRSTRSAGNLMNGIGRA